MSYSFTDEMTSDLMKAGNDIRHTLFGAFSPTQNVTHKLRTSLERVRYASLFPILLLSLIQMICVFRLLTTLKFPTSAYSLLFVVYSYYQIIYMNLPMENYTSQPLMFTQVKIHNEICILV